MNNSFAEPEFVNLSKDMCQKIHEVATRKQISFSEFVREAIQRSLDEYSTAGIRGFGDY
jgi:metal-responsive CopG/Arc/MetJ family transcriptional regulator